MTFKFGLVGLGAMGSNHARVISENPRAKLERVFDLDIVARQNAAMRWNCSPVDSIEHLFDCDAVVIASSTQSHIDIANILANAKIPLLIEKPLSENLHESEALVREYRRINTPLMCGFVERFNPAVITGLGMLSSPVRHLYSSRHSPHNLRASSSVISDLLIHDLDLTARLAPPKTQPRVASNTWKPLSSTFDETADCTIKYSSEFTSIQSASRWGQRKIREIRITTDDLLVELDLLRATVTAYRHRSHQTEDQSLTYRTETMIEIPFVRHVGEPLTCQLNHFIDLISDEADVHTELDSILPAHELSELVSKNSQDNVT
jgi:predicted dehydrogenase